MEALLFYIVKRPYVKHCSPSLPILVRWTLGFAHKTLSAPIVSSR